MRKNMIKHEKYILLIISSVYYYQPNCKNTLEKLFSIIESNLLKYVKFNIT